MPAANLLDTVHRTTLEQWARGTTLFVFDYDGTLAPLCDEPENANMLPDTKRHLEALAKCAPVAVISGRARADLVKRLPDAVQWVLGNHGNDGLPRDPVGAKYQSQLCSAWHQRLMADADLWLDAEGASIDNKGRSLTLDFQSARNPSLARSRLLATALKLEPPPRVIRAINAFDLLPQQALSKADAIIMLMQKCKCDHVMIVADDVSMLQEARENWMTVHVGTCLHSDAHCLLRDLDEVGVLLFHLRAMREGLDVCGKSQPQHAEP